MGAGGGTDRSTGRNGGDAIGPVEAAAYIAAISGDLARLAEAQGFPFLAYLLRMARVEAQSRPLTASPGANSGGIRKMPE